MNDQDLLTDILLPPVTQEDLLSLSSHERAVMLLLSSLNGFVQGFPDHPRKLFNVTKAFAAFMVLEPYHVHFDPQIEPYMSKEDKARFAWKEGVVPGKWLIDQIRDSCKWMPAPIEAREIYLAAGFKPRDGKELHHLASVGRRRAEGPEAVRPADVEEFVGQE